MVHRSPFQVVRTVKTQAPLSDNSDGTYTLTCPDGSSVVVSDGATGLTGADGEPCTVADNGDGSMTLTCPDGTSATVSDGTDGLNALIETVTLAPGADCERVV